MKSLLFASCSSLQQPSAVTDVQENINKLNCSAGKWGWKHDVQERNDARPAVVDKSLPSDSTGLWITLEYSAVCT